MTHHVTWPNNIAKRSAIHWQKERILLKGLHWSHKINLSPFYYNFWEQLIWQKRYLALSSYNFINLKTVKEVKDFSHTTTFELALFRSADTQVVYITYHVHVRFAPLVLYVRLNYIQNVQCLDVWVGGSNADIWIQNEWQLLELESVTWICQWRSNSCIR